MSQPGRTTDRLARILEASQLGFLGIWLGSLLMVAVIAAIAFPTMRDLDPTLPGYSLYPEAHWEIAAGHIMAPAFRISDAIQVLCASGIGISMAILLGTHRMNLRRPVVIFRLVLTIVLLGVLIEYLFRIAEPMQTMLPAFWAHAQAGEAAQADSLRQAFDVLHPKSSMRLGALMVGVLLAMVVSIFSSSLSQSSRRDTP